MAQDDAHIYSEPQQVEQELASFFEMTQEVYGALGLSGVEVGVSTRPEESYAGEPADWDAAEAALIAAVKAAGFDCTIKAGDAAFYGPKVECDFRDVLGRPWTLATLQIDVSMPARFGLEYVGRDGAMHQPAMLHRAILGSLERFIALYIERTAGNFPFWLAPLQVAILPITDRHMAYAEQVEAKLSGAGIRAHVDGRSEKLGFKIREAEIQKIPLMLVVGDKEVESGTVTPRRRHGSQQSSDAIGVDTLVAELSTLNEERRAEGTP
jgi:threonyl-tRNA synthetase